MDVSASPLAFGFMASDTSQNQELEIAAAQCAATGATLLVSSKNCPDEMARLHRMHPNLPMLADTRFWSNTPATADETSVVSNDLFDLDMWAQATLSTSGMRETLNPAAFVKLGDGDALRAVLAEACAVTQPAMTTFIATDADALTPRYLPDFLAVVRASHPGHLAFLFAHKAKPLAKYPRLQGLRTLLQQLPGSDLHGVDVPAGTDALAHGAGLVTVGASSGRRWPTRPGDSGGGPQAAGFVPGTYNPDLMEMRSPAIYVDWYANSRSPFCEICHRNLDGFQATPTEKSAVVRHNLHAVQALVTRMAAVPAADRARWLNEQRIDALDRHVRLTSTGAVVEADATLRALCELDDPQMRSTTRSGAWI